MVHLATCGLPQSLGPPNIRLMLEVAAQIDASAKFIRGSFAETPVAGIVLGTGLGGFANEIEAVATVPYGDIPHFPTSTAMGHKGRLVCGFAAGQPVIAMQGRFHAYEGYPLQEVTHPIRVMRALGAPLLIASNASGGLNPAYRSGDLMVLDDHLNLMFDNPLFGVNDDRLGPRFPDMSRPYDLDLIERCLQIARRHNFTCHRGVYAALAGPNYETRAEYRMLRRLGADVVGMSTVPETIVAVHAGMKVLAISVVTNVCQPDSLGTTDGQQVVDIAQRAEPHMRQLVLEILSSQANPA